MTEKGNCYFAIDGLLFKIYKIGSKLLKNKSKIEISLYPAFKIKIGGIAYFIDSSAIFLAWSEIRSRLTRIS